jgi:hypothetical protein
MYHQKKNQLIIYLKLFKWTEDICYKLKKLQCRHHSQSETLIVLYGFAEMAQGIILLNNLECRWPESLPPCSIIYNISCKNSSQTLEKKGF